MVDGNDLKKKGLPLTITLLVKVILARPRDVNANLFFSIPTTTWEFKLGMKEFFWCVLLFHSYSAKRFR